MHIPPCSSQEKTSKHILIFCFFGVAVGLCSSWSEQCCQRVMAAQKKMNKTQVGWPPKSDEEAVPMATQKLKVDLAVGIV